MTKSNAMLVIALMLAAPLTVLGVANQASAQDLSSVTTCEGGPDAIRPLGAPGSWNCNVQVKFGGGLSDPVNFYTVTFTEQSPSWANVIISPATISGQFTQADAQSGQKSHPFSVDVALTQNAPAFTPTKVTISAAVQAPNAAQEGTSSNTQLTVTPGYFNLYNVRLQKKIGQGGPQEAVQFPIQIDNFSNGETRFDFNLKNPDNIPTGFQPVTPEPTVLQSEATGGETTSTQVTFSVYTPYQNGYVNEVGAIQLDIASAYAPDTTQEGASSTVATLTQARGFYVPGPGAGLAAIALVGVALVLARNREFGE